MRYLSVQQVESCKFETGVKNLNCVRKQRLRMRGLYQEIYADQVPHGSRVTPFLELDIIGKARLIMKLASFFVTCFSCLCSFALTVHDKTQKVLKCIYEQLTSRNIWPGLTHKAKRFVRSRTVPDQTCLENRG